MKVTKLLLFSAIGGLSIATACSDSFDQQNDSSIQGLSFSTKKDENLSVFLAAEKEAFKSESFSAEDLSILVCNSRPKHFFTKKFKSDFNIVGSKSIAELQKGECSINESYSVAGLFDKNLSKWEETRVDGCGRAAAGSVLAIVGISAVYKILGRHSTIRMFDGLKEGAKLSDRAVATKVLLKAQIKAAKGKSLTSIAMKQELAKQLDSAGHMIVDGVKYSDIDDAMAANARYFESLLETLEVKYLGKKAKKIKYDIKPNTAVRSIVSTRDAGLDLKTNQIAADYLKTLRIDIGGELPANFLTSDANWKKITDARKTLMKDQHADIVGDATSGADINIAVQELAKIRKQIVTGKSQEFIDDSSLLFEEKELNALHNLLRSQHQQMGTFFGGDTDKALDALKTSTVSFAWIYTVGGSLAAYFGKEQCKQNPLKARKNAYTIQVSEPKKLVPLNVELNIAKTFAGDKNVSEKLKTNPKYKSKKTRVFLENFNKNNIRPSKVAKEGKQERTKEELFNLHF